MSRFRISTDERSNAKLAKSRGYGYLVAGLSLASGNLSGHQVCAASAAAKCIAPCLVHTGQAAIHKSVNRYRIIKTQRLFNDRESFMADLRWDLKALVRAAGRASLKPAYRPNVLSDLNWCEIVQEFPEIQFYDYFKDQSHMAEKFVLPNYDLTYSLSAALCSPDRWIKALERFPRCSAVFSPEVYDGWLKDDPSKVIQFNGVTIVSGDRHDLTFLNPQGVILALRAKGHRAIRSNPFVYGSEVIS